jgi:hypothetical protein
MTSRLVFWLILLSMSGNTDFWRNDLFTPVLPSALGNQTFGADRDGFFLATLDGRDYKIRP